MKIIPPEAYTHKDLALAYSWLQGQPEHVQKLGRNKDTLISLYKRAMRNGEVFKVPDAPISSTHFRSDLKDLANGLRQFEPPQQTLQGPQIPASPMYSPQQQQPVNPQQEPASYQIPFPPNEDYSAGFSQPQPQPQPQQVRPQPQSAPSSSEPQLELDPKSWKMIQMVREQLNLSSDSEALRMIISVGFERVRSLFPQR